MKNRRIQSLVLSLAIFLMLIACRGEESIIINGPEDNSAIAPGSNVQSKLAQVAMKDGSEDNILDMANCLTVELPVSINVNGVDLTINTEDDFDLVEDIFEESFLDDDIVNFSYPIAVILSDHSRIFINSVLELEEQADKCNGENEDDEDIESVDFIYPISFSTFNTSTEQINTVTVSNDEELYNFVDEIEETALISIRFPVTLVSNDGIETIINDIDTLEDYLDNANLVAYDEDDDFDYDDDDCLNCTADQLTSLLTGCSDWFVDKLEIDNNKLEDNYIGFTFNFNNDGTINILDTINVFAGTW
ncbi:MAG: hypothetical protein HKN90_01275, partial [Flavobacteriaceae bacterium]|nr:hypothetical protein [Flavobacteriaceae bacterium]